VTAVTELGTTEIPNPQYTLARAPRPAEDLKRLSVPGHGSGRLMPDSIIESKENGKQLFKTGEGVFNATHSLVLEAPNDCSIYLREGTTARVIAKDGLIIVQNIKETELNALKVRVKNHIFECSVGSEIIICDNAPDIFATMVKDNIARRHLLSVEIPSSGLIVNRSEVDLTSLMQNSPLMRKLYRSRNDSDKDMLKDIMQTIVSYDYVKRGTDPYHRMAGLSTPQ
jgi:hypothetical protein